MSLSDATSGIDGARRQQVAVDLWTAWREHERGAAILTGFSGLGKTEQVVRPLLTQAAEDGHSTVMVEVPLHPIDLDHELKAAVVERLRESGPDELVQQVGAEPNFSTAVGCLLRGGTLVVLDEFQRMLDPTGLPIDPLGHKLQEMARRAPDEGCLWLVTNRQIDPEWTEPFYEAVLEAPTELSDQERIVLDAIGRADAEDRFQADRRLEIIRRLGANPRVLRLLGTLLRIYAIDELLGPPGDAPSAPVDPRLMESMERSLLAKAEEGLSGPAKQLLRDLTILRGSAQWELVEAIGAPLGDVRTLSRALRERYLLEIRVHRYRLHPVVREVEGLSLHNDPEAWREAHRRAGTWYARPLHVVDRHPLSETDLALRLSGARYHLIEAQAFDEFREAMRGVQAYIERTYGWGARNPASAVERDAQISLLSLHLDEPGDAAVESTFAKLLKQRGAPGDLETALPHAERATEGQDFAQPWVLWIQLVREVEGLEAAKDAARKATERVAPEKNLFSIYQILGSCLGDSGQTLGAVDVLLEGAERSRDGTERVVQEALLIAVAHPEIALLQRVRDWGNEQGKFGPVVSVADVLLLEHRGDWHRAAEVAHDAGATYPTYLYLAIHEALCWLGAGDPKRAQEALDRFPNPLRHNPRGATTWLEALVALHRRRVPQASELLAIYLDADAPSTEAGIRSALLREWDHRVATIGEQNPALTAPILPASVTGLDRDVRRPQHGPPVLPQHQQSSPLALEPTKVALHILAVATEWQSGQGGLSTFNRQFCRALAATGAHVICLVVQASEEDQREATVQSINLLTALPTPGRPALEALTRKPALPDNFTPDLIIGHGRVTGPAAKVLAEDHFPTAKRLHVVHMAPDEIEWYKPDRQDDAGARAQERTQIELDLSSTAARVVAVGPRLHNRYLRDLSTYNIPAPIRLDPGFDVSESAARTPPPGDPWSVLVPGRLEDDHLKGIDIAARAVGLVASRRSADNPPLELLVRGALPDTSTELQERLRDWSNMPSHRVVVRPYTSEIDTLTADLQRASLLLMPSRVEGFGLVGLEAIVAGTPALISEESGLGRLLHETLEPEQSRRFVVPILSDTPQTIETWSRDIEGVLRDRDAAFRRAAEVRNLLGAQKTWAAAIAGLLAELQD